jgi:hypothetical protein
MLAFLDLIGVLGRTPHPEQEVRAWNGRVPKMTGLPLSCEELIHMT